MITVCLKNICFMECINNSRTPFGFTTKGKKPLMKNFFKPVVIGEEQTRIQDLRQKIDALTTVVKSSTLGESQTETEQQWNYSSKDEGQQEE